MDLLKNFFKADETIEYQESASASKMLKGKIFANIFILFQSSPFIVPWEKTRKIDAFLSNFC